MAYGLGSVSPRTTSNDERHYTSRFDGYLCVICRICELDSDWIDQNFNVTEKVDSLEQYHNTADEIDLEEIDRRVDEIGDLYDDLIAEKGFLEKIPQKEVFVPYLEQTVLRSSHGGKSRDEAVCLIQSLPRSA